MKAQKLGLVLGMNMAVACMMMQGCKANKAGNEPLPADTTVVAVAPTASETKQASATLAPSATATTTTASDVETVPGGVVIEPGPAATTTQTSAGTPTGVTVKEPSKVAAVKPLPPPGKPAATPAVKGPAATGSTVAGPTAAPAAAGTATEGFVYTVKNGDQLFAISRRYNVKMAAIQKANPGLNPDKIKIGQKITIPGVAAPAPTAVASAPAKEGAVMQASATTVPAAGAANTVAPVKTKPAFKPYVGPTKEYVVKSGDSLGKIAYENGITIRALKELNQLTKDNVRIGQKLQIPSEKVVAEKPAAATTAKADPVKKPAAEPAKPTAAPAVKAADEKKADVAAPAAAEKPADAKPADVKVEEAAPAADPEPAKVEEPVVDAAPAAPVAGGTYTVKEGDDLVSVSIAYGISPSQLMDLNGLKAGDAIKAGQVLKIPANAKPTEE